MVKRIEQWEARDGSKFSSKYEASVHEAVLDMTDGIEREVDNFGDPLKNAATLVEFLIGKQSLLSDLSQLSLQTPVESNDISQAEVDSIFDNRPVQLYTDSFVLKYKFVMTRNGESFVFFNDPDKLPEGVRYFYTSKNLTDKVVEYKSTNGSQPERYVAEGAVGNFYFGQLEELVAHYLKTTGQLITPVLGICPPRHKSLKSP